MNYDILLKYFDIVDEYVIECVEFVVDVECILLFYYFQLLFICLMNNEEISEEV